MSTAAKTPRGGLAVANNRRSAVDTLDLFPTPPYATRALLHLLLTEGLVKASMTAWEPAAGLGHMADVMRETFADLHASDVFDYGRNHALGSFTGEGADVARWPKSAYGGSPPDWIITNPPFNGALDFALRAIDEAAIGAALLVRTNWIEGGERYRTLFSPRPPQLVVQFAGRVAMVKDRWDANASTMTSYCWVVWHRDVFGVKALKRTQLVWLPETTQAVHTHIDDAANFSRRRPPWALCAPGELL